MAGPTPQYIPPPPPPPPPGYGEGGFGGKPTSGMAVASLVCGLVGMVSFFCWPLAITSLVGLVLGILGLIATGREGPRSGRGLAIAGTIVSVVSVGVMATSIGLFLFMVEEGVKEAEQDMATQLDSDQRIIIDRLKKYYDENAQSLGPGGPILAGARTAAAPTANGSATNTTARVTGSLKLQDLVQDDELRYGRHSGGGAGWEMVITGKASATLRAKDWGGTIQREVEIQDIGRNQYVETVR
jgi:hypothetical protein